MNPLFIVLFALLLGISYFLLNRTGKLRSKGTWEDSVILAAQVKRTHKNLRRIQENNLFAINAQRR